MSSRRKFVCMFLVFIALLAVVVIPWLHSITAYVYALSLEESWSRANPQTKAELEKHLSLYSTRTIQPSQSGWGKGYVLADGERMIQYRILWNAELDVVYDSSDNIEAIFTSYE